MLGVHFSKSVYQSTCTVHGMNPNNTRQMDFQKDHFTDLGQIKHDCSWISIVWRIKILKKTWQQFPAKCGDQNQETFLGKERVKGWHIWFCCKEQNKICIYKIICALKLSTWLDWKPISPNFDNKLLKTLLKVKKIVLS